VGTSRLTSKGQVTIPKPVRDQLGLRPGDVVEFVECSDGVRVRRKPRGNPFEAWRGFLTHLEGQDPVELVREMRGE
jgi:AbrB family looped-hinge helix DNA binding protein